MTREWFAGVDDTIYSARSAGPRYRTPRRRLPGGIRTSGRTPSGVWGGKLMWNRAALLQAARGTIAGSARGWLARGNPRRRGNEPVFVHVHRPDVVSQAVAFWRAVQTQVWRAIRTKRDSQAVYAGAIAHIIRNHKNGWHNGFARVAISPTRCYGAT